METLIVTIAVVSILLGIFVMLASGFALGLSWGTDLNIHNRGDRIIAGSLLLLYGIGSTTVATAYEAPQHSPIATALLLLSCTISIGLWRWVDRQDARLESAERCEPS